MRERERERERETIFQRDCWGNKYIALVHQLQQNQFSLAIYLYFNNSKFGYPWVKTPIGIKDLDLLGFGVRYPPSLLTPENLLFINYKNKNK